MKLIKRISGKCQLLLLVLGLSTAMMAQHPQGQQGPPPMPEGKEIVKMVNQLDKEIDMTDAQEAKVLKLYQAHFAEIKESMSKGRPDRTKMESMKTSFEKKVKAELTKDQVKKFVAYQKKSMPEGGQGGNRPQH